MAAFNDFSERFLKTIEAMGLSDYKVWNTLENLSKSAMSQIRRGKCGVSMNVLQEFLLCYEEVNANYILTGRGSMFINSDLSQQDSKLAEDAMQRLIDEVQRLRAENRELKDIIYDVQKEYQHNQMNKNLKRLIAEANALVPIKNPFRLYLGRLRVELEKK